MAEEKKPEKTLEERVFALESLVASLAGHVQPVAKVEEDKKASV